MCDHLKPLPLPNASSILYKEECTLCFENQDSENGIDLCLTCYNGSCTAEALDHTRLHYEKWKHPLYLNIKRRKSVESSRPEKITKLLIENQTDKYDFITQIKCISCGNNKVDSSLHNYQELTRAVLDALSASKKSDIKAWEEETLESCYHTENLVQAETKHIVGKSMAHCNDCELQENIWLCLNCGNLGCGRAQYGGVGGNGHALKHFENCKHPIAVKMGSITPEGTADVFCYEHGKEIVDPDLGIHLSHFNINILTQKKTQKSLAEMQLEQNLKFDFSLKTSDGKDMTPMFGPGLTGLKNLGNSCYLASVMQTILSIPQIQETYFVNHQQHIYNCREMPANCFVCQMGKLSDGLLSGRYSIAIQDEEKNGRGQDGISPGMFKAVIGKGHPEFSSMRQQDAQEFLQHVLATLKQKERPLGMDSTKSLYFQNETRLQCLDCERVHYSTSECSTIILRVPAIPVIESGEKNQKKYQSVHFLEMVEKYFEPEMRDYSCPVGGEKTMATFFNRFKTYPEYLFFVASRFVLGEGWVMEKLSKHILMQDVPISTPLELDLESYRGHGLQEGEVEFPADQVVTNEPFFDEDSLNALLGMGFPENRCKRALIKTGNNGADIAMNWLFEHMDDPDIDDPITTESIPSSSNVDVAPLMDMGFTKNQALRALKETNNNMERAVDWLFSHPEVSDEPVERESDSTPEKPDTRPGKYRLFSLISHKGTSAGCGHYVAFVKKGDDWVLFNDNKVVHVPDITEASEGAYVYVYQRI